MSAEDVGAEIKRVRVGRGMSLRDLGREADVGFGNLCDIENGKKSPKVSTLRKIARGLGVHPGELL